MLLTLTISSSPARKPRSSASLSGKSQPQRKRRHSRATLLSNRGLSMLNSRLTVHLSRQRPLLKPTEWLRTLRRVSRFCARIGREISPTATHSMLKISLLCTVWSRLAKSVSCRLASISSGTNRQWWKAWLKATRRRKQERSMRIILSYWSSIHLLSNENRHLRQPLEHLCQ